MNWEERFNRRPIQTAAIIATPILLMALVFGASLMYGCPKYKVWQKGLEGEAELAQANANRQIKVAEAQAAKESAVLLAEAEVERAKGVATANKIIGDSLKNNDAYLRYLWITSLGNGAAPTVVYIPTEAGLPILEANRLPALTPK